VKQCYTKTRKRKWLLIFPSLPDIWRDRDSVVVTCGYFSCAYSGGKLWSGVYVFSLDKMIQRIVHFLDFLGSGGSRAARMASSKTFFNPR